MTTLQVAGFLDHSTINGEGFRSVLFLAGCNHNCMGCHNIAMQDFNYGDTLPIDEIMHRILKNTFLIDGVTISGGEPFEQSQQLLPLLTELKNHQFSIWVYTGYLYETLKKHPEHRKLLPFIDVLVDGPYLQNAANPNLRYIGSSNQRILKLVNGEIASILDK